MKKQTRVAARRVMKNCKSEHDNHEVIAGFFQGVLETLFGSLKSEKIGSLESEKSGPYWSIPGS